MEGGSWALMPATSFWTAAATSTVFTPGWRWMARVMFRRPWNQLATLLLWTSSITSATSWRRTGEPPLYETMRSPNSLAFVSWPLAMTVEDLSGPYRIPVGRFTFAEFTASSTSLIGIPREERARG